MPTTTSPGPRPDAVDQEVAALPLVTVLRRLVAAYVVDFDRRLLDSEFCALSLAHSRNVLRHLGDGPLRAGRLVELAGVTKQAISQQLVHLERNGYITTEPDPSDQRARLVVLTDKGRRAQELVRRTFADIEQEWARHLGGDDALAPLRDALELLLVRTGSDDAVDPGC